METQQQTKNYTIKTYYIYVLRLKNGKFYVGSTLNLISRLKVHFYRGGAVATKEFKPEYIEKIYYFNSSYWGDRNIAEQLIAREYISIYGVNEVRGARNGKSWSEVLPDLEASERKISENQLKLRNSMKELDASSILNQINRAEIK